MATTTAKTGMRRDWTFTATLEHKAARATLRFRPQWTAGFIDLDDITAPVDPQRRYTSLKPWVVFTDLTASAKAGEAWSEIKKEVSGLYSHVPTGMSLRDWCKRCVQYVLSDERVVAVDDDRDLKRLRVGGKLDCTDRIAGRPTFRFTFKTAETATSTVLEHSAAYGIVAGSRGYLFIVRSSREEELTTYIRETLLPALTDADQFKVDAEVSYDGSEDSGRQEYFGVLRYFDATAAIEFTVPFHPMRIKPDHSPIQSGGHGSLATVTLDMLIYDRAIEDIEVFGSKRQKYKAVNAVVHIEVEDVLKNKYPAVMSIDQYATLKMDRVKHETGATIKSSLPNQQVGKRCGRSTTFTFPYELGDAGKQTVQATAVSTLVGSLGATALFLTSSAQGVFDAHMYLLTQLLQNIRFYADRELSKGFTLNDKDIFRVRITDQDLQQHYAAPADGEADDVAHLGQDLPQDKRDANLARHLAALHDSTDGQVKGVDAYYIDVQADPGQVPSAPGPAVVAEQQRGQQGQQGFLGGTAAEVEEVEAATAEPAFPTDDDPGLISITDVPAVTKRIDYDDAAVPGGSTPEPQEDPVIEVEEPRPESATEPEGPEDSAEEATSSAKVDPLDPVTITRDAPTPERPRDESPGLTLDAVDPNRNMPAEEDPALVPTAMQGNAAYQLLVRDAKKPMFDHKVSSSLRQSYVQCCHEAGCAPNSHLVKKLPENPTFVHSIEELDLSHNYVGPAGFVAVLRFMAHLPLVHTAHFNFMALENGDIEAMVPILVENKTLRSLHLRSNPRVTLPACRSLSRLLRDNTRITELTLTGCGMGVKLITELEAKARANAERHQGNRNAARAQD